MDDIFCKIISGEMSANKAYEDEELIAIMDAFPFNPGHVLVIPKKHYTTFLDMDDDMIVKVHNVAKMLVKKMEETYPNIRAIKIIVNYGDEQKVKHYHMHLLPFYEDDKSPDMTQEEFCDILKR